MPDYFANRGLAKRDKGRRNGNGRSGTALLGLVSEVRVDRNRTACNMLFTPPSTNRVSSHVLLDG